MGNGAELPNNRSVSCHHWRHPNDERKPAATCGAKPTLRAMLRYVAKQFRRLFELAEKLPFHPDD